MSTKNLCLLLISCFAIAGDAEAQTYGNTQALLIEKDPRGELTESSRARLAEALIEIAEHGALRAWVAPRVRPGSSSSDTATKVQGRILRKLTRVAAIPAAPQYPAAGPYMSVSIDTAGAQLLARERIVDAFWVLVPRY